MAVDAAAVRAAHDEAAMVALCSDLIRIPSFSTQETPAVDYLEPYFRERGYQVDVQEIAPGRKQIVATLKGSGGGKSLMFNGHLDIDPVTFGWERDPFEPFVDGNRLYGAGSFNMKGGVAAMIEAAEMLRRSGTQLHGDVVIACVAGELQGGLGTEYIVQHGPKADCAIVTEPYGKDHILTVHAGVMQFAVHTFGLSRHISIQDQGIDAIAKMMKAREAIATTHFTYTPFADMPDLPRVSMGAIIGGQGRDYSLRGPQFSSDYCTGLGDVRFVPGQTRETVLADLRRALDGVAASDPDFRYEIEAPPPASLGLGGTVMTPFDLPRDALLLKQVIDAYRTVMDREPRTPGGPMLPMSYAGNDTAHLWSAGIPCLLYGPGGEMGNAAGPDHYTRIDHMSVVAKVLATVATEVCDRRGPMGFFSTIMDTIFHRNKGVTGQGVPKDGTAGGGGSWGPTDAAPAAPVPPPASTAGATDAASDAAAAVTAEGADTSSS